MGKLSPGTVLDWSHTRLISPLIHNIGADQLLKLWKREAHRQHDELLWGDEVEYLIVQYDDTQERVRLSLDAGPILERMAAAWPDHHNPHDAPTPPQFHPEASTFNLESTPGRPYRFGISDLLSVEADMAHRSVWLRLLPYGLTECA